MAVTVAGFYENARERTSLKLVACREGFSSVIHEPSINRPGLALTGFFKHFAFRRIQVLGMAENELLATMTDDQRKGALRTLFEKSIPCLVMARNRKVPPEVVDFAVEFGVPVFRTPLITGVFINMATMVMERLMAPRAVMQGTMIDVMGTGVLIEGRPGIGKSESALALIERGHTLVSDDVTIFRRVHDRTIVGMSPDMTRYHIEIHGLGIIHVPSLFGVASVEDEKTLDLIVSLESVQRCEDRTSDPGPKKRNVLGVGIPAVTLPVAPGRPLADVIELAALNEKLKRLGHDAAKELDQKLLSAIAKKG